jgi:PAS domain S-box-containing protein
MQDSGLRALHGSSRAADPSAALAAGLFRAHFERLPGPAYIWERHGDDFRLIAHNRAAAELPLTRITELLGTAARDLFAGQPQVLADLYECARTGNTVARQTEFVYLTAGKRIVEMTSIRLTPDIVVVHSLDVTEKFEADRALYDSERRYRTIVDNAHEGIWVCDAADVTTFVNRRAAELLGCTPEEMIGRPALHLLPEEMAEEARTLIRRRRAGSTEHIDFRLGPRNGADVWVSISSSPMLDFDACFVGSVSMLSDITQRRSHEMALRASEAKIRLLLDSVPDMITHVDRNGRHLAVYVSDAEMSRLPYEPPDLIGHTCSELFGAEFGEEHQRHVLAALASGKSELWEYEFEFRGTIRHMEARFVRISDDEVVVACRDHTERVDLEREVIAIGERERIRIGHDLHDGLAQLLTGIKLLMRSLSDKLEEEGSAYGADARRATELVQHAIGQTSELARGLSPIPKRASLSDGLIQLAEQARKFFGVECRYAGSTTLPALGDDAAAHLYRIAQEAVTNAVRHGKAASIELRCDVAAERLILTILDDGVGLREQETVNNGMGLRIMRYRARSLGGMLTAEPGPHGGTRVVCSCPLSLHRR